MFQFRNAFNRFKGSSYATLGKNCVFFYGSFLLVGHYVGYPMVCSGTSMMPTLNPSMDAVLVDATPNWTAQYGINDYKVGDVVIFRDPNDRHQKVCKRIRAVENDEVYKTDAKTGVTSVVVVPKGHVWLAGDNPLSSRDSRDIGPITLAVLEGKVRLRLSPCHTPRIELIRRDVDEVDAQVGVSVQYTNRMPVTEQVWLQVAQEAGVGPNVAKQLHKDEVRSKSPPKHCPHIAVADEK